MAYHEINGTKVNLRVFFSSFNSGYQFSLNIFKQEGQKNLSHIFVSISVHHPFIDIIKVNVLHNQVRIF